MSNNVETTLQKYRLTKENVEVCRKSIIELQKKCDALQESLPELSRAIENTGRAKTTALDAFALNSDEKNADRLKRARVACEDAIRQRGETQELLEASERGLKVRQAELIRLNEAYSQGKRAVWQAIADDLRSKIPAEMIEAIRQFALVSFTQIGGSYDFCLKSICPQPAHEEGLAILQEFREKYQID